MIPDHHVEAQVTVPCHALWDHLALHGLHVERRDGEAEALLDVGDHARKALAVRVAVRALGRRHRGRRVRVRNWGSWGVLCLRNVGALHSRRRYAQTATASKDSLDI